MGQASRAATGHVIRLPGNTDTLCHRCGSRFETEEERMHPDMILCPKCGHEEETMETIRTRLAFPRTDRPGPKAASINPNYPILLNHEIMFMLTLSMIIGVLLIVAQFTLSLGHVWFLDVALALVFTLLGIILTDDIVNQIEILFAKTLAQKIDNNHLYKSLKLKNYPDRNIDFFIGFFYTTTIALTIFFTFGNKDFHFSELPIFLQKLIIAANSIWHLEVMTMFMDIAFYSCLLICGISGIIAGAYHFFKSGIPPLAKFFFLFPIVYLFHKILVVHESFKSIIKVFLFIIITLKEFLASCLYLTVSWLIGLQKKHNIANLEVDYLLYVRLAFAVAGMSGYLLIAATRY